MFTASSFFSVRFEQLFFDINKTYWGFGLKSRHLKTSLCHYCFSLERSMADAAPNIRKLKTIERSVYLLLYILLFCSCNNPSNNKKLSVF